MKNIPVPIQKTLAKTIVCQVAIVLFGIVWAIANQDYIFLLLSAAVGVMGGWRAFSLHGLAADGRYEVIEGTIMADKGVPLRNRHNLIVQTQDGYELSVPLTGKSRFKSGCVYQLYLSQQEESAASLPEQLRPVRTLLGYEEMV